MKEERNCVQKTENVHTIRVDTLLHFYYTIHTWTVVNSTKKKTGSECVMLFLLLLCFIPFLLLCCVVLVVVFGPFLLSCVWSGFVGSFFVGCLLAGGLEGGHAGGRTDRKAGMRSYKWIISNHWRLEVLDWLASLVLLAQIPQSCSYLMDEWKRRKNTYFE